MLYVAKPTIEPSISATQVVTFPCSARNARQPVRLPKPNPIAPVEVLQVAVHEHKIHDVSVRWFLVQPFPGTKESIVEFYRRFLIVRWSQNEFPGPVAPILHAHRPVVPVWGKPSFVPKQSKRAVVVKVGP